MKLILTVSLAFFSLGAFAQGQGDLMGMKKKANEHLDKKMTGLENAKNCINAATSVDKFKACKYDMHEDMKKAKKQAMEEKTEEMSEE